jgi:hypothetical protein
MKIEFNNSDNQAQILRKVIDIENEYSPLEMFRILDSHEFIPVIAKPLFMKNIELMHLANNEVRAFNRVNISKNINLYQGKGATQKSLIISFCGHANRMMLPIASYLQLISDDKFDVLILRDPSLRSFLSGIPEYESSLSVALSRLENELIFRNYRTIRCIGTSGGGGASLYSGIFLNSKYAFSIGGKHPTLIPNLKQFNLTGITGNEFDEMIIDKIFKPQTKLFAIFAEHEKYDESGAESLKKYLPSTKLICINDLIGHNIFLKLLDSGHLPTFFNQHLLID